MHLAVCLISGDESVIKSRLYTPRFFVGILMSIFKFYDSVVQLYGSMEDNRKDGGINQWLSNWTVLRTLVR